MSQTETVSAPEDLMVEEAPSEEAALDQAPPDESEPDETPLDEVRPAQAQSDEMKPAQAAPIEHWLKLFDSAHYAAQIGSSLSVQDLLAHYRQEGAAAGLSPHPDFDAKTYMLLNPDVPRDPFAAFEHYARHGRSERRYANSQRLMRDVGIVQRSSRFDHNYYASHQDLDLATYGTHIAHYLTRGWKQQKAAEQQVRPGFLSEILSGRRQVAVAALRALSPRAAEGTRPLPE